VPSIQTKKETVTEMVTVSFWQGQKDSVSPAGSVGASALRSNNAMSGLQMGCLENTPQKHSRIACLERFALLLVLF